MQSKFDIYLARVSSLVQIGLFAVALATIYFTVIPLYKAAQVEEALARKELEYERLSKKVDILYSKNRKWEVSNLARRSIDCLGWDSVIHQDRYDFSWSQDIAGCLDKKLVEFGSESLTEKDFALLNSKFQFVKKSVLLSRDSFEVRYDSYEDDLRKDPSLAPKQESMISKLDSLGLALGISKKELDKRKHEQDLITGRAEIVSNFLSNATDILKSINGVEWSKARAAVE